MHGKRPIRSCFTLALLSTLIAGQVLAAEGKPKEPAAENYQLQYKFKMGEVIRYAVRHTESIHTTIEGTSDRAECKSESIKAWKVTDVLPSGEMEFTHLVEVVRMTNRVQNRAEITFNSESDEPPPPGFEQAARAVGIPLSVLRIDTTGKVTHREEKHPQQETTEDMPITLLLPDEPVAVGEQWDKTYDLPMERKNGTNITVRTRRVCTLKKVADDIAKIHVKYQILTPVSPHIKSQMAERLSEGHVYFDIEHGRVISQRMDVDERVIGFVGKASSIHCVSRLEERLLKPGQRLAKKKTEEKK